MLKFLVIISFLLAIVICGCTENQTNSPQTYSPPITISTPTPETTFYSPASSGKMITPIATLAPTRTPKKGDPIIGTWTLENAPYTGTAIFFEGGSGRITVGLSIVSTSKQFSWSNIGDYDDLGNVSYRIALADDSTIADGILFTNGTILSSILPSESYLTRYR